MSLSVRDLSYSYGAKQALRGVGFDIAGGEFCALLGPNGAGKSTLFALLTRLFTTETGSIIVAGHDLRRSSRKALAEIGVVFQQSTLDLNLSVDRNLRYFAALQGLSGQAAEIKISEALERLGMAERRRERVRDLNGGHRRRTEIARSLIHSPSVLLLDEPTVGLDAATRTAITDHVHDLCANQGLTVLWATHLTDEVRNTDQLVILHRGKVLTDGLTRDIVGDRPLTDVFLELTGAEA